MTYSQPMLPRPGQILHSDATGTPSTSGVPVEMYEHTTDSGARVVTVEAAGVPIVTYSDRDEATGVFYLLLNMPGGSMSALLADATGADFPVQS